MGSAEFLEHTTYNSFVFATTLTDATRKRTIPSTDHEYCRRTAHRVTWDFHFVEVRHANEECDVIRAWLSRYIKLCWQP